MLSSSAPLSKHPQDIGAGSPSLDKHLDKQTDSFPSTEDQDDIELAKLGYKSECQFLLLLFLLMQALNSSATLP
jgi:hypothetical protein